VRDSTFHVLSARHARPTPPHSKTPLSPTQIPDLFTLRLAAFAARTAVTAGRARTRSPYTELVVCLSSGKNVRMKIEWMDWDGWWGK
jgi:hypothetical protein